MATSNSAPEFSIELNRNDPPPSYDSVHFKNPTSIPSSFIVQPPQNSTQTGSVSTSTPTDPDPEPWEMHNSSVNSPTTLPSTDSQHSTQNHDSSNGPSIQLFDSFVRFPVQVVTNSNSTSTTLHHPHLHLGQQPLASKDYRCFVWCFFIVFVIVLIIVLVVTGIVLSGIFASS